MLFSDHFGVRRTSQDDWFDPILHVDTKLFVDPFLIFLDDDPYWSDGNDELVAHFDRAFKLLAASGCSRDDARYGSALSLLRFPEPPEFCLGYTARGTRGAGGSQGFAAKVAKAMCKAIARGITHLDHFEAVGIFEAGIGPDRVSDITCNILKPRFIEYTQAVARRHGVSLVSQRVVAGFDPRRSAPPQGRHVELPVNPKTGRPVLLVPERFLRELPTLNADDWFESSTASEVRDELSAHVLDNIDKAGIVLEARRHARNVDRWIGQLAAESDPEPYDLPRDPSGLYQWHGATSDFARRNPMPLPAASSHADFIVAISAMVDRFKHFIEQERGWKLLWNDTGPGPRKEKNEEAAQLVFQGLVAAYCEANNIDIGREVELGRGPVDFKFSTGFEHRALLEVKKLTNGKFWNGIDAQLPSYLKSAKCTDGWFLAIQHKGTGVSKERVKELPRRVAASAKQNSANLAFAVVDARPKKSASKLRPGEA